MFDIIEMYRIYVDKTVIYLFSKKLIKDKYFDSIPGGMTLNKEGKALLIEYLNNTFDRQLIYRGRNIRTRNIIQLECHSIANDMIKKRSW